jgi:hypothetical protein
VSRVCGSAIEVDIVIEDGVFVQYGHAVSACALGQTSAAIVAARDRRHAGGGVLGAARGRCMPC